MGRDGRYPTMGRGCVGKNQAYILFRDLRQPENKHERLLYIIIYKRTRNVEY